MYVPVIYRGKKIKVDKVRLLSVADDAGINKCKREMSMNMHIESIGKKIKARSAMLEESGFYTMMEECDSLSESSIGGN